MSSLLTNIYEFDPLDIEYDKAKLVTLKNERSFAPKSFRIPMYVTKGSEHVPLIIATERCFSFGVQNTDGKYSMPIILWDTRKTNEENATNREWVNKFSALIESIKEYLLMDETKAEICKPDLEERDLKKFSPLYYKKDKQTNKIIEDSAPSLYCKFRVKEPNNRMNFLAAHFYDFRGNELEAEQLVGKKCMVQLALRVESIWVGSTISLQFKIHEANVELMDNGRSVFERRLLSAPADESKFDEE